MNPLSNIWQHPRTSVAGLLIAALTIAGVLSQQGITLGHAGTGSVVSLAAGLATAFLGLLARDPAEPARHPIRLSTAVVKSSAQLCAVFGLNPINPLDIVVFFGARCAPGPASRARNKEPEAGRRQSLQILCTLRA